MSHRGMFFALNRPIVTTSTTTTTTSGSCTSGQIDNFYTTTVNFGNAYDASTIAYGQVYISNGGKLEKIEFKHARTGSPTGNSYAKVYAVTGTPGTDAVPTGSVLATSAGVDVSTFPTSNPTAFEYIFSGADQINLSASTAYAIVVEHTGSDTTNYISMNNTLFSDEKANSNLIYYANGWFANSSADCHFKVTVCA